MANNEKGDAAATMPAAGGGDGANNNSEELAFLKMLEAEEAAGRTAEPTKDSQGSSKTGSPGGAVAAGEETGEEDDAGLAVDEDVPAETAEGTDEGDEGESVEGEDVEEETEEEQPEFKGRVQKRINKLTAKLKTLEERNSELDAELKTYRDGNAPSSQGPWDPMNGDQEYAKAREIEEQARAEKKGARELLRDLGENPDRVLGIVGKAFKVESPTESQARRLLEEYVEGQEERLTDAKTRRAAREAEVRQINAQAGQVWRREAEFDMPWLRNANDSRHKHMRTILKAHPWVKDIPAGTWLVAAAAHKLAVMEARQRASQKATRTNSGTERRIVPTNGRTTAQNARSLNEGQKRYADAAKRHLENPDDDALTELLDAAVGG